LNSPYDLVMEGIPGSVAENVAAVYRSRFFRLTSDLMNEAHLRDIRISIGTILQMSESDESTSRTAGKADLAGNSDDVPVEVRARQYKAQQPLFDFDQLVLQSDVIDDLQSAVEIIHVEHRVFDEWGLRKIEPFPRTSLNFHGQPGTGKTLAAHAIARSLERPILVASYAEIESKFHGDGPKNVKAIFYAAERDNAVLFVDEADSLLSKRLTEVTQGSEQAINSMRSQLFICLEGFRGVVVFATNLVENYDKAFETRVRHIYFPMPDEQCRREIWQRHLLPQLPQAVDVSVDELAAQVDDICGRDIKNAVIDAAVRAARQGKNYIEMSDLLKAVERIKAARIAIRSTTSKKLDPEEEEAFAEKVRMELIPEKKQKAAELNTSNDGGVSEE
jgi:ATP-dependent 26S proteasome regulatory subunit